MIYAVMLGSFNSLDAGFIGNQSAYLAIDLTFFCSINNGLKISTGSRGKNNNINQSEIADKFQLFAAKIKKIIYRLSADFDFIMNQWIWWIGKHDNC